ncbi:hypothetical protein CCYA_CCYA10G2839 [Cyanidiococcus yangmingshanensis]|nr:hypothetical protein CCYA_CCYA10G2839 [Cyanidiococcus yangmingshanensis]
MASSIGTRSVLGVETSATRMECSDEGSTASLALWRRERALRVLKRRRSSARRGKRASAVALERAGHDLVSEAQLAEDNEKIARPRPVHEYVIRIRGLHEVMQQQQRFNKRLQALADTMITIERRVRDLEQTLGWLKPLSPARSSGSEPDSDAASGCTPDRFGDDAEATQLPRAEVAWAVQEPLDTSASWSRSLPTPVGEGLEASGSASAPRNKRSPECAVDEWRSTLVGPTAGCSLLEWAQMIWRKVWIRVIGPVTVFASPSNTALAPRKQRLFPEAMQVPQYLCLLEFQHDTQLYRVRTTDGFEGLWAGVKPSLDGGFQNELGHLVHASRVEASDWIGTRIVQIGPKLHVASYAVIRCVWGDPVDTVQVEYEDGRWSRPLPIHSIQFQCVATTIEQCHQRFICGKEFVSNATKRRSVGETYWIRESAALETPFKSNMRPRDLRPTEDCVRWMTAIEDQHRDRAKGNKFSFGSLDGKPDDGQT